MSVSGRLSVGLIRCTGKYDNISFKIKTPFFNIHKEDSICYHNLFGMYLKNDIKIWQEKWSDLKK